MPASSRKMPLIRIYDILFKFYGPQRWWPGRTRFEIIVGAILTQNTAWTNVEKAIANLRKGRLLSAARMRRISETILARHIRPAGCATIKAKRIFAFLDYLYLHYSGALSRMARKDTVQLRNELLGVHGIGPETCDSMLLYAFKRPVFVVDAYTRRIFSRHSLFLNEIPYEEIQNIFMNGLPEDVTLFNEYHALIVVLAKEFCRTDPKCGLCPLALVKELEKLTP